MPSIPDLDSCVGVTLNEKISNFTQPNGVHSSANKSSSSARPQGQAHSARLSDAVNASREACPPIAIVGMGMRLPGGVKTDEQFWKLMTDKADAVCRVPESRYNVDAFYSDSQPHSVRTKHGYFLEEDPAEFDAGFFSMSKQEASRLDPQQRLLLEVVWECMESAGQNGWQGKDIGCYVGVFGEEWLDVSTKDTQLIDRYHALATGIFALSNIVSFKYDLTGPSMTLATGCSASLVGLHEACQALYSGDCSSAIVAGTNLIFTPTMTTTMSDNMVLAPDGICKTFDAAADGYGRGEAINAIYIKPLSSALRDGDPVRAVIRGTSTNCDGTTPTITTPGSKTQKQLIMDAYKRAQIDIADTAFFECHGTGTVIGDSAETTAVADLFRPKGAFIGAVKPNVGHSEGASGITSVIKAVLALERKTIPPNAHFADPNPNIPFKEANLQVPVEPTPWPADRKERISVNCFGIGGSNAHAILESSSSFTREPGNAAANPGPDRPALLLLSASSMPALKTRVENMKDYVDTKSPTMRDLEYTLINRREHLPHRAFMIGHSNTPLDTSQLQVRSSISPLATFVFTGQGAQWVGMGKGLMEAYPSFAESIKTMDRALQSLHNPPSWRIEDMLLTAQDVSRINEAEFSQPLCTAIQIAIVDLLETWGIRPTCTVGHSSGEIAAAYASEAINAETAVVIAYYRGLSTASSNIGAMAVIGSSVEQVRPFIENGVVIACENSPQSTTISGDTAPVENVIRRMLENQPDTFCRRLRVNVAYHSDHMKKFGSEYEGVIAPYVELRTEMKPLYSSVTGAVITDPLELGAPYWRRNLESPVLFSTAVEEILRTQQQNLLFVEIGPHAALAGPIRQIFNSSTAKSKPAYISTLVRGENQVQNLLQSIGNIYSYGLSMNPSAVSRGGRVLTDLPRYPWIHSTRYWTESRVTRDWRHRRFPHHELLGSRVAESSDMEPVWKNYISLNDTPWLSDHVLVKDTVFPGAGYIAMAGEAIRQITESEDFSIRNLHLKSALSLDDLDSIEVLTSLKPVKLTDVLDSDWYDFAIVAYDGKTWIKLCSGRVCPGCGDQVEYRETTSFARRVSAQGWYRAMGDCGLKYGPRFQGLEEITADPASERASAFVQENLELHGSTYSLHPTIIDQALQLMGVGFCSGLTRRLDRLAVPITFDKIYVAKCSGRIGLTVDSIESSGTLFTGNIIGTMDGRTVLSFRHASFFSIDDSDDVGRSGPPLLSSVEWRPDIDMVSPDDLLSFAPMNRDRVSLLDMTLSCIIESEFQIRSLQPECRTLQKYQRWLGEVVDAIRQGNHPFAVQGQRWIGLESSARREFVAKLDSSACANGRQEKAIFSLMHAILHNLVSLFEEERQPLEVLMEGDGLKDLYDSLSSPEPPKNFMSLLRHSRPRAKVLEVGAGTGSSTELLLEQLHSEDGRPTYSEFSFTDISPSFFPAAKERLKEYRGVKYSILDISKDPTSQGFDPGTYDFIIASNVLHATPSIRASLENVRRLLRPGGWILMHELDLEIPFVDYIMGILPGWWLGEADNRPDKPYIPVPRWDNELLGAGFDGVHTYVHDDISPCQAGAYILARAQSIALNGDEMTLVYKSKIGPWAESVADHLSQKDYQVRWRSFTDGIPSTARNVIFLIDVEGPFLSSISQEDFDHMKSCLSGITNARMLWITPSTQSQCENPDYALTHGFVRTVRKELMLHLATVEVDKLDEAAARAIVPVYEKFRDTEESDSFIDYEFALRNGAVYTPRFIWKDLGDECTRTCSEDVQRKLSMGSFGILDSMEWVSVHCAPPVDEEMEVEIRYVGLNFRDIMCAMGLLGQLEEMGLEGSGIVRRVGPKVKRFQVGDKVILSGLGLFQTTKVVSASSCVPLPGDLSLQEGATLPVVFATVIHCLIHLVPIKAGQSILIHSACGGVGLAAIQVCQMMGAKIYATVGNEEKATHLTDTFGIPRHRIFDSRSTSFLGDVMRETSGKGVDIVLNSLSGKLLHASWECVARSGKMIELGKRDFIGHGKLDMDLFASNRAFFGVDLLDLQKDGTNTYHRLLEQLGDWFQQGELRPISPMKTFKATDIVDAFHYMQQGVHMGKILIEMPGTLNELPMSRAKQPFSLSPEVSYLLAGGLGGGGQAIATWMVENGARHLTLFSRTAGQSDEHKAFVKEMEAQGCNVAVVAGSITRPADIERAIAESAKPIAGVIQMSMVLNDQNFIDMTLEEWDASLAPKVEGTWNLHRALQGSSLDFFVVLSSMAGICGNPGQANYAAANSFLDSFVTYRRQRGLAAFALALGVLGQVGYVSRDPKLLAMMRGNSLRLVQEKELVAAIRLAICQSKPHQDSNGVVVPGVMTVGMGYTKQSSTFEERMVWGRDARFSAYDNLMMEGAVDGPVSSGNLKGLLLEVEQDPNVLKRPGTEQLIMREIGRTVTNYTPQKEEDMSEDEVAKITIDSLMSVEIRNWFRRKLAIEVTVTEITKAGTVGGLASLTMEKLKVKYLSTKDEDKTAE